MSEAPMEAMRPTDIMSLYSPGDEHSWSVEFDWLYSEDFSRMAGLLLDVAVVGIRVPVLLGPDGRVWDGHHRIYAAYLLGIEVPVEYAKED